MCGRVVTRHWALPGGRSRTEDDLLWLPINGNGAPILCFFSTWVRTTLIPRRSGLFWIKLSRHRLNVPNRRNAALSILRICLWACQNLERRPAFLVPPRLVSHLLQR